MSQIQKSKQKRKLGNKPEKPCTAQANIDDQLLDAIKQEKPRVVKRLLESKANPNTAGEQNYTPLILACTIQDCSVRKTIVDLLLKKGADVNQQTTSGRSAMMNAVLLDGVDTVSTLLVNNCDINLVDCDGNNALCYAAMLGNNDIVRKLVQESLRRSTKIDHQNMRGLTALLLACQKGHLETARIIAVEGGASTTIRDLENFMNAHDWMRLKGTYTTQELAFLLPTRKRRDILYYQDRQNKDDVPSKAHSESHVFTVKSFEESKSLLPTLPDHSPTKSASTTALVPLSSQLFGPRAMSMYNISKRSMFDVPVSQTCTSSTKLVVPIRPSIPTEPFSTVKRDVYRSSYLDRRKSILNKSRKSEYYHRGALAPIGFDPNEKINKLATVQHTSRNGVSDSGKTQKHNSLPPL